VSDQLLAYLREHGAARERGWLPVPRYRQGTYLIVKFRCGHSETTGGEPASGLARCHACGTLQMIDRLHQPRFLTPGPSAGRRW